MKKLLAIFVEAIITTAEKGYKEYNFAFTTTAIAEGATTAISPTLTATNTIL
jgi:hypothetical protein